MKERQKGFTIIEVLIVLAIAGLIISIVFLAIPTLQRNSRNNQRNQDVASILEGVSRWGVSHNSGEFPGQSNLATLINTYDIKLTFYSVGDIQLEAATASQPALSASDAEKVKVYNYQKCDPDSTGAGTIRGAGYGDIAALYTIESSSGSSPRCKQL